MQTTDVTHYPDYNVLELMDEWDSHTREIVKKRLGPFSGPSSLSESETLLLKDIIKNITFDDRDEIINWVVAHIDQTINNEAGENQRKSGTPKIAVLIRTGLAAVDHLSKKEYSKGFCDLEPQRQSSIIGSLQLGTAAKVPEWSQVPPKEFFKKLASEIISAYYSHPIVWSDIGYGGPAYPRGYVRLEFGVKDPWEAKLDGK